MATCCVKRAMQCGPREMPWLVCAELQCQAATRRWPDTFHAAGPRECTCNTGDVRRPLRREALRRVRCIPHLRCTTADRSQCDGCQSHCALVFVPCLSIDAIRTSDPGSGSTIGVLEHVSRSGSTSASEHVSGFRFPLPCPSLPSGRKVRNLKSNNNKTPMPDLPSPVLAHFSSSRSPGPPSSPPASARDLR